MKLEVGMYVRTKKGKIYKFETNNSMAKNGAKKYMVNCSYNLIDLIEVGDYVNGELVVAIHKNYVCDEIELGTALETACNYTATLNEDIKSIVTKEMFSSMEYRLGDD